MRYELKVPVQCEARQVVQIPRAVALLDRIGVVHVHWACGAMLRMGGVPVYVARLEPDVRVGHVRHGKRMYAGRVVGLDADVVACKVDAVGRVEPDRHERGGECLARVACAEVGVGMRRRQECGEAVGRGEPCGRRGPRGLPA